MESRGGGSQKPKKREKLPHNCAAQLPVHLRAEGLPVGALRSLRARAAAAVLPEVRSSPQLPVHLRGARATEAMLPTGVVSNYKQTERQSETERLAGRQTTDRYKNLTEMRTRTETDQHEANCGYSADPRRGFQRGPPRRGPRGAVRGSAGHPPRAGRGSCGKREPRFGSRRNVLSHCIAFEDSPGCDENATPELLSPHSL